MKNSKTPWIIASFVTVIGGITLYQLFGGAPVEENKEIVIEQTTYIPPPPKEKVKSPVSFTDMTQASNIDFVHYNGASLDEDGSPTRYMPETMGPGIALFDFDQDGDLDLFVTNGISFHGKTDPSTAKPRLYRNDGDFTFEDVSELLGDDTLGYWMGAAVGDYNGDTYPDLFVTGWGRILLLENNAGSGFIDVTQRKIPAAAKFANHSWTTAAVFFDADQDNDLDLFIADYVKWSPEQDVFSTIDGQSKSYATPDLYHGGSSHLFLFEDGLYVDKTAGSGMEDDQGKSLGVALWDFNEDGLLDIVVANDTQPNFLYLNLGNGQFEDNALIAGIAYDANGKTRAGMGIDVADIGNDNFEGITIGNFSREPLSMFRDEGQGFFRERSQASGIAETTYLPLTFGLRFADFDLDGWQDLVAANGHIEPGIENIEAEVTYKQTLTLLGNVGEAHFDDWSGSAGDIFKKPIVGRGLATGDLDGDGDIDFVVSENSGGLHIARNDSDTSNRSLRVKLQGQSPNTQAVGAKIEIETKDGMKQMRLVRGGSSYLSHSELTQTFGLGNSELLRLSVTWPNGISQTYPVEQLGDKGELLIKQM